MFPIMTRALCPLRAWAWCASLFGFVAGLGCGTPSQEPDFGPELQVSRAGSSSALPSAGASLNRSVNPRLLRRFKPLRLSFPAGGAPRTREQIDLGRMLFFDARLSKSNSQSCNSCHPLDRYGVDGEPTSRGASGARGRRNSPSIFHAAGQVSNFWDGRAASVEEQAGTPLLNPAEMAMSDKRHVVATLAGIPGYGAAFAAAFPGEKPPLTFENVGRAIGAFERGLVTPSRWDRYLLGDSAALTGTELGGLKLFTSIGCVTCHTGELIGGLSYQKVGLINPWPNQADQGRFEVTKQSADRMMFKVPPLRNVAATAPYFHDGSVPDLAAAVRMMATYQLGEELSNEEVAQIVAWLDSLTGDLPLSYIAAPDLPPSAAPRN
jgi:cytochrome c peroxidase